MKILIVGGGFSSEREVSLKSSDNVIKAAKKAGFKVEFADPKFDKNYVDDIDKDTVVFPMIHGVGGEDGYLQSMLEDLGIPYLGCDSESSANSFDKWKTRLILEKANIPMAKAELVTRKTYKKSSLSKKPHVLKIVHGGSSIGTLIVTDPDNVSEVKISEIFDMEQLVIIEEMINGVEITVPILDQTALPAIEIRPPEGGFFDYVNKYNGKTQELCPPPSLNDDQHKKAQELAEKTHKVMDCRHLSRVDLIMRPDSSFVVLEINTIPGMTEQSLYPKSAAVVGLSMPDLVKRFVRLIQD